MGDCIGALLAYEAMCQEQWSLGSFETNPYDPVSPVSKHDKHFDSKLRVCNDMKDPATQRIRSSISDTDIHGSQYDTDVDFPKRSNSMSNQKSASVEDGLDSGLETYAASIPFRVRKLEFDVSKFFAFGSPIGLVLLHKKLSAFSGKTSGKCLYSNLTSVSSTVVVCACVFHLCNQGS